MADCELSFTRQVDPAAYDIYLSLQKEGVGCADVDGGVSLTNYSGKACPNTSELTCIIGAGDKKVGPEEVYEFALKDERFHRLVETSTRRMIPWTFDGPPEDSAFTEQLKKDIKGYVSSCAELVSMVAPNKNSPQFQETFLYFLFCAVAIPKEQFIALITSLAEASKGQPGFKTANAEIMIKFFKGMRDLYVVQDEESPERTAVEALKAGRGKCTERSKILYALLKEAGFSPFFVMIEPQLLNDIDELEKYRRSNQKHLVVGVKIGNDTKLLDPSIPDLTADEYKTYFPLSLRQYFSLDMINMTDSDIDALNKAIAIDSSNYLAHLKRCIYHVDRDDHQGAIADMKAYIGLIPPIRFMPTSNLFKKWEASKKTRDIRNDVGTDTNIDIEAFDMGFVSIAATWELGQRDEALRFFDFYTTSWECDHISENTASFFKKMIGILPVSMKKDPAAAERIDKFLKKLK